MSNTYSPQEKIAVLVLALKEISSPFPTSVSAADRLVQISKIARSALEVWDGKPKDWDSNADTEGVKP
jgi:hypothetical protein